MSLPGTHPRRCRHDRIAGADSPAEWRRSRQHHGWRELTRPRPPTYVTKTALRAVFSTAAIIVCRRRQPMSAPDVAWPRSHAAPPKVFFVRRTKSLDAGISLTNNRVIFNPEGRRVRGLGKELQWLMESRICSTLRST
ncbi:hypothetical protein DF3PB_3520007 [uncultured Defluviicoccus sp.]|uniref:Uncharacterized protein n=1 Tax=metagenome TaxID=256318 RepID=A0A380TET8_9ZZZZ|nr:hypothetical protein DF3PB_3520007 [uncultured Defluviicoccus sp.]